MLACLHACAMTSLLLLHPLLGLQGLKVVRMAAKSRESIGSSVEHLTLHHQVCRPLLLSRLSRAVCARKKYDSSRNRRVIAAGKEEGWRQRSEQQ